jgi:hypothetical protein
MSVDTPTQFAKVIQDHLELKKRNAALEPEMPLSRYLDEDPLENHPLFKSEEQARIEETMSGQESIVDAPTTLSWPTDDTFVDEPAAAAATEAEPSTPNESDEGLWARTREFDWGD